MQRYTTLRAVRTLVLLCVLVLIEPFAASGCGTERAINVPNEVTSVFFINLRFCFSYHIFTSHELFRCTQIVGIV